MRVVVNADAELPSPAELAEDDLLAIRGCCSLYISSKFICSVCVYGDEPEVSFSPRFDGRIIYYNRNSAVEQPHMGSKIDLYHCHIGVVTDQFRRCKSLAISSEEYQSADFAFLTGIRELTLKNIHARSIPSSLRRFITNLPANVQLLKEAKNLRSFTGGLSSGVPIVDLSHIEYVKLYSNTLLGDQQVVLTPKYLTVFSSLAHNLTFRSDRLEFLHTDSPLLATSLSGNTVELITCRYAHKHIHQLLLRLCWNNVVIRTRKKLEFCQCDYELEGEDPAENQVLTSVVMSYVNFEQSELELKRAFPNLKSCVVRRNNWPKLDKERISQMSKEGIEVAIA